MSWLKVNIYLDEISALDELKIGGNMVNKQILKLFEHAGITTSIAVPGRKKRLTVYGLYRKNTTQITALFLLKFIFMLTNYKQYLNYRSSSVKLL